MNSLRETFVKFFLNGRAFLPVRCIRGFHIPRLLLSVQNVPYLRHILSLQFCDSYGKYVALHSEFILTFSNILTELLRHHIFFFLSLFSYTYSCFPFKRCQEVKAIIYCVSRYAKLNMIYWVILLCLKEQSLECFNTSNSGNLLSWFAECVM